jgi:hypothetical protein
MRFRPVTLPRQSDHDFRALRMFVGAPEFDKLLKRRIDMISTFGFITDVSRMAYEVEIGLQDIGHNARKFMDQNRHRKFHVAADFVIGAAQIISQFSQKGRRTLQGQIIDGLKSAGLFKLHHELRVAAEFSKCGYDVELTGIENEGCQDFIIRKGSSEFEVEAKAFEHDAGAYVNLRVAENLFQELRESDLGNVNATGIPVTNIRLQGKLPRSEQARREIVKACKEAFTGPVRTRSAISFGGYVEVITEMSLRTSKEGVDLNLKALHRKTGIIGFANHKAPRFVIHIISGTPPEYETVLVDRIKDAARRQFSKKRPAVVWCHSIMPTEIFTLFESRKNPDRSIFRKIAVQALRGSPKPHLQQNIFSGGSYLSTRDGNLWNTNYRKVVFNLPHCRFSEEPLLPGTTLTLDGPTPPLATAG